MPNIFGIHADERVGVFIDGPSANANAMSLDFAVDFDKMNHFFDDTCRLMRSYYYALVPSEGFNPIQPLLDFLSFHGFTVNTKTVIPQLSEDGKTRLKGSLQTDIAVDMLGFARRLDHIVLFTGDGDITPAVRALKAQGLRVTVVCREAMTSNDLRRQADNFVDFTVIKENFLRPMRDKFVPAVAAES
jgi:uncharacterized LabA/DUF88 family protein